MSAVTADHLREVLDSADCLYDNKAVATAYEKMAQEITGALSDLNPLVLCVMNGGLVATGQLLPRLNFILQLDYVHATRYRGETTGSSELQWKVEPQSSFVGRHILLIDDILDEGMTLYELENYCCKQGAESVRTAVLVDKQHSRRRPQGYKADFTGLYVEDRYVFGCGMDYKGYLRNIDGIYAVSEDLL